MNIHVLSLALTRRTAFTALATALLATNVCAQTSYPTKPVRFVLTLPAGSSPDVTARFIAERLSRDIGQPVVVDNKPGASSIIGTTAVAKAPADGYTLLYAVAPSVSINPHVFTKLPYKASDFVPIIHLLNTPSVVIVPADSPYTTMDDLLQDAKRRPGKLTFASYGDGTPTHLAALDLMQKTGTDITHVPYKDGGLLAVMSGVVDWSFEASAAAIPQIRGGKLRALAVSSNTRIPMMPNIPTLTESVPGLQQLYSWNGVFAPRGTPPEVIAKLSVALQKIAASNDFRQNVLELGLVPVGGTPAEFSAFLAKDSENWGAIVKRNNIRLD